MRSVVVRGNARANARNASISRGNPATYEWAIVPVGGMP